MRPLAYQCFMHDLKPFGNEASESADLKDTILSYKWSERAVNILMSWSQHTTNTIKVIKHFEI